jgi:hypothetical protein
LIKSSSKKAVLFIDDLDRCRDEDVLNIMRTVNYLSSIDNLYIVMAIDKDRVIEAIARVHENLNFNVDDTTEHKLEAQKYVEKIFNLTLNLPTLDSEFIKSGKFSLSPLEKDVYSVLDKIRWWKNFILNYMFIFVFLFGTYYFFDDIKNLYSSVTIIQADKESISGETEKSKEPAITTSIKTPKEPQTDIKKEDIKQIEPTSNIDIEKRITKSKSYVLPISVEKNWFVQNWRVVLSVILAIPFVVLLLFMQKVITSNREQKERNEKHIWKLVNSSKNNNTPRRAKILYNQVRFVNIIGTRSFTSYSTLPILHVSLKLLYWFYFIGCFLFCRYTKKENLHETKFSSFRAGVWSCLFGISKLENQDDDKFEKEVEDIIKHIDKNIKSDDKENNNLNLRLDCIIK